MSKLLKKRRKELGKEIKEIAEITRIKASYLKAIEEEDFSKLPVEVYTRGYIREYAEHLRIPADVALDPYERYMEEKRGGKDKEHLAEKATTVNLSKEVYERLSPPESRMTVDDEPDMQFNPEKDAKTRSGNIFSLKLLWLIPLLIAVTGVYLFTPGKKAAPPAPSKIGQAMKSPEVISPSVPANKTEGNDPVKMNKTVSSPPQELIAKTDNAPVSKSQSANVIDKAQERNLTQRDKSITKEDKDALLKEKGAVQKKKHSLDIIATGKVWIQVVIDGAEKKEMLLNPGDKVNYGADNSFALNIGNAAGVKLRYDGKVIENLGGEGVVVKLNLPQSGQLPGTSNHKAPDSPDF